MSRIFISHSSADNAQAILAIAEPRLPGRSLQNGRKIKQSRLTDVIFAGCFFKLRHPEVLAPKKELEANTDMIKQPTKLNGYPVVRIVAHENGYSTVICDRGKLFHDRWVVGIWSPDLDNGWSSGSYTDDRQEADEIFDCVKARNRCRS